MLFKYDFILLVFILFVSKVWSLSWPRNVTIESLNLRSVLHWNPVADNRTVKYTVQYITRSESKWQDVPNCAPTLVTQCNFSSLARPYVNVTLRVRTEVGDQTSSWQMSKPFNSRFQTRLGPPTITVQDISNSVVVIIRLDPYLKKEYGEQLQNRIYQSENGNLKVIGDYGSTVTIKSLKAGTKFCVQARYIIDGPFQKRLGDDLSEEKCVIVRESEEEMLIRKVLTSVFSVALVAVLVLVFFCVFNKYRRKLKQALRPPVQLPDHIREFCSNVNESDSCCNFTQEKFDKIHIVKEDALMSEHVLKDNPLIRKPSSPGC